MSAKTSSRVDATLPLLLRAFKLPAFVREYGPVAARAGAEGLTHEEYLLAHQYCTIDKFLSVHCTRPLTK